MQACADACQANGMTAQESYDFKAAEEKLRWLGEARTQEAMAELKSNKVVTVVNKGRPAPGRSVVASDHLFHSMKKNLDEAHFRSAAAVKADLDEQFRRAGKAAIPLDANDGYVLALINLLAHGRVQLAPFNPPANRFGLMDGDYKTRFMDKARIHFDIEVRPTSSYEHGHPLGEPGLPPRAGMVGGERLIPLWYDIHDKVVPGMWAKVVAAVMSLLAVRPRVKVEELERCLRPASEAWELQLLLRWMQQAGAATELAGGWTTTESWWLLPSSL